MKMMREKLKSEEAPNLFMSSTSFPNPLFSLSFLRCTTEPPPSRSTPLSIAQLPLAHLVPPLHNSLLPCLEQCLRQGDITIVQINMIFKDAIWRHLPQRHPGLINTFPSLVKPIGIEPSLPPSLPLYVCYFFCHTPDV